MIDETAQEIREMQTHSSSIVAIKAARAMEELLEREFATVEEYKRDLERNGRVLGRADPAHASLHNVLRTILERVQESEFETVEEAKQLTQETIDAVIEDVRTGKRRAAENAARHLTDGATLLTHDYSSTVLQALDIAIEDGKRFEVYVTEARPRHLGRKAARELGRKDGIETTHLITDGASGHFMPECEEVVIGMDCIIDRTLYNRVGTYPLAATADHAEVPLTVVGNGAKIISDFRFENDFRSPSEVMREPPEGFVIENPAYDATPIELVSTVITDDGPVESL